MLESTRESGPAVDLSKVREVERRFGVSFPAPYITFLLAHNGGRPTPPNFFPVIDGRITWMRIHFLFGIDHEARTCDLLWNFDTYEKRMPKHVIPIASDEAGNRFCLDLRRSRGRASVLFWDHEAEGAGSERTLRVLAPSFEDWLEQLTHHV